MEYFGTGCDVELLLPVGHIQALVVPGAMRWFGLRTVGEPLVIPWQQIEQVGEDVILVRLDPHRGGGSLSHSDRSSHHHAMHSVPIRRYRGGNGSP